MLDPTRNAASFYPASVKPAPGPLRFPLNFAKLLRNNLELIPEQAYHEPLVMSPGPPRMAFITGTELVKDLLFDRPMEFPKARLQVNVLKPLFGRALVSAEGREWRWQRGAATPLFRHEELMGYVPTIAATAEAVIERWQTASPNTVHAIERQMVSASFRIISKTMMAGIPEDMLRIVEKGQA